MDSEWGPWIHHDGLVPPVNIPSGAWVNIQGVHFDGTPHDGFGQWEMHHAYLPQWTWKLHGKGIGQVHRYRIRKQVGVQILEKILADVSVGNGNVNGK
jgi:hypothetical protein